ncbi:MAG: TetR/AcrR family transcriptional regulator [Pseudodonghicola sp.]
MTRADPGAESDAPSASKDNRKHLVEQQLLEQASLLFATKGYAGTSLSDIADAVGLTRAAIYYYFKNKEAVLEAIMLELIQSTLAEMRDWQATAPEDASERLRRFVEIRITRVLENQVRMRMIDITEATLPPDLLARHNEARRRILDEYRGILRHGISQGVFRPVDDRVAALAVIGLINWTLSWYAPDRGPSVQQVAAALSEQAVQSVAVPVRRADSFDDIRSALRTTREDLDQLEALLDGLPAARR